MRKLLLIVTILILGLLIWQYKETLFSNKNRETLFSDENKTSIQTGSKLTAQSSGESRVNLSNTKIIAENLEVPWALVFLPDRSLLVTQRTGQILLFSEDGSAKEVIAILDDVLVSGEGGLLGITIHSDFRVNNYIYLYYTYSSTQANTLNRVVRYKFSDKKLRDRTIIVDDIPGASNHNGGRLKFGPDRFLYITTGDAQNPSLAQDKNSLAGKILRVTDEGKAPLDNPFGNLVYSYGHRNAQGLAWDQNNQLWATEHGPSAQDELNKIEKGGNFGWPEITGDKHKAGMISPVIQSGLDTWAPAGLLYSGGVFYFAGLRGQALYSFNPATGELDNYFKNQFGRIREAVLGPDNKIYLSTSNRDGRAIPKQGDDKIIKIYQSQ